MKQLPYGNSNFRDIMLNNYAYVDKTRYIEMLEDESNYNTFLVRPRGFGKSLFISTLESYYDIKQKDDFEKLFGNLYIGQHPTPKRNSYAVLKFNFSGVDSFDSDTFNESFSLRVHETVCDFLEKYRDYISDFDSAKSMIGNDSYYLCSFDAISTIMACYGNNLKICVLIDDYDSFARHLVAAGKKSMSQDKKYLSYITARNFIIKIKSALESSKISRTFITASSYATWNAISEIQIDDISNYVKYSEIMGFTESELYNLCAETLERGLRDEDKDKEKLKWRYGGYKFNVDDENELYNPEMSINFVKEIAKFHIPDAFDEIVIENYKQLEILIHDEMNCRTMQEISKNNKITYVPGYYDLMRDFMDEDNLVLLLVNLGLLTIDKFDLMYLWLKPPNYFARCILNYFVYTRRKNENHDKILFLDIDGVLQPYGSDERFEHIKETEEFYSRLYEEIGFDLSGYNPYDVMAVYYDWDKDAVAELKRILDTTGAKIVISSAWRDKTIYRMMDLCKIHNLDDYIIDATPDNDTRRQLFEDPKYKEIHSYRALEIIIYLDEHPDIKNYVAIDDINLTKELGEEHTVTTYNKMKTEDAKKCIKLLKVKKRSYKRKQKK
jgi:hypothetical protein